MSIFLSLAVKVHLGITIATFKAVNVFSILVQSKGYRNIDLIRLTF